MREVNASYARCGELELRLDPLPPQPLPVSPSPDADPIDEQRRLLADLLHSSGADPEPFVEAIRRQRAA